MSSIPALRPNSTRLTQLDLFPDTSDEIDVESAVERWLPVEGWPGYEVSDHGNVRSYHGRGWMPGRDLATPVLLAGHHHREGHVTVNLCRVTDDGGRDRRSLCVHDLVLTAFRGPCPIGLQCCRVDGNLSNNRLSNLDWGHLSTDEFDPASPERWLPIPEWPHYEVSDLGRMRTYKVRYSRRISSKPSLMKGEIIGGYARVLLTKRNPRQSKLFLVHRLVLMAFVGMPPEGMMALHNNGNSLDSRLCNLRWGDASQNQIDSILHGTSNKQDLMAADIPDIWGRLVAGESATRIARDYGVNVGCIGPIKRGENWTHITKNLPGWPILDPKRNDRDACRPDPAFCDPGKELWRPLPGFDGYRVSNHGRFQTCRSTGGRSKAQWRGDWHYLDGCINKGGYVQFCLRLQSGKRTTVTLHQAVMSAFVGPCPEGLMVCHNDGDRLNCHASNLRYDTALSNSLDRIEHERIRSLSLSLDAVPS